MALGGLSLFDSMTGRIVALEEGGKAGARAAMESMVDDVVAYAQENAIWADRTGAARAGLEAAVSEEGDDIYLELYHTVEHGQWLETIQNGRFAIIMPTLEIFAPRIFARAGATFTGGDEE